MTFEYFAYGSNMWDQQLRSRCPSARALGPARLDGWRAIYDKPSTDGSSKMNIRPDADAWVEGVVYEIADHERALLDRAEPMYTPIETDAGLTYAYEGEPSTALPYDWYVATVESGADAWGLSVPQAESMPDPVASGVRPADESDRHLMESILSEGLLTGGDRYYVHPGELGWWMYHGDDRRPFSWWVRGESAFVVIDPAVPGEISVFALPGESVWPLINWSRRRLGGGGEVGWVSDEDLEFEKELAESGHSPVYTDIRYEWDLTSKPIPEPRLPQGWSIRPVSGEHEADARRAASHAAFRSTMSPEAHLDRYLRFMRSPVYEANRDLVVAREDGTIGSFMVWWGDRSGFAQVEPFGTHPDFHRMGLGRALMHHALHEMKRAGMAMARVLTDEPREATAFYEGVGFDVVGRLRWWALDSS